MIVYPNSGATYDPTVKQWRFEEGTPRFVNAIDDWITAGAAIIGGVAPRCPKTLPWSPKSCGEWEITGS